MKRLIGIFDTKKMTSEQIIRKIDEYFVKEKKGKTKKQKKQLKHHKIDKY